MYQVLFFDFVQFLSDLNVETVSELTVYDIETIAEEFEIDVFSLLFVYKNKSKEIKDKISKLNYLFLMSME